MLSHDNDKKKLIESMKKLACYVSNNKIRQQEIFNSLSTDDLRKILNNLQDSNQYLRRIAALLVCELFYNNHELKLKFVEKMKIPLINGSQRIVLNAISSSLARKMEKLNKCYQLIKRKPKAGQQNMFCWVINLDKKSLTIDYYQLKKYSSFTFLDPSLTVFGITIGDNLNTQKQANGQNIIINKPEDISNSQEKKYNIVEQKFFNKPSTSNEARSIVSSNQKQKISTYKKWRQSISGTPSETGQKPSNSSIYSISRNSQTGKKTQNRVRKSLTFHNELSPSQIQKESTKNMNMNKSTLDQENSSIYETQKKSQKNNYHHDNFYRKVQQILRK